MQFNDLSLVRWQGRQGRAQALRAMAVLQSDVGRCGDVDLLWRLFQRHLTSAAERAPSIADQVVGNGQKPRLQGLVGVVVAPGTVELEKRLLGEVAGFLVRGSMHANDARNDGSVAREKLPERAIISSGVRSHQLLIAEVRSLGGLFRIAQWFSAGGNLVAMAPASQ